MHDDELVNFEANGAVPLPTATEEGYVVHEGASIWYASYGSGPTVVLLHGGLGHSGNWGYQLPTLVGSGFRAILIDSRGHGRSTRDSRPYSYDLMASDVLAVMDKLGLDKSAVVGWSDGAIVALMLAMTAPLRIAGVYFFACKMDPSGNKEFEFTPILRRCMGRHEKDYSRLSETPDKFDEFCAAVSRMMDTQPNCSAEDLSRVQVPVAIVLGEHDEFIKREHAEYMAATIPGASLSILTEVSHFAPLQRPEQFDSAVLDFLAKVLPR